MKSDIKIAILGGDRRLLTVAELLSEHYNNINIFGIGTAYCEKLGKSVFADDMATAVRGADVIVLPLPCSSDGFSLNCPLWQCSDRIRLASILEHAKSDALVVGGRIPQGFADQARERGLSVEDYFTSELFQVKNAYTTAEAALSIAMNSLTKNIYKSKIAITGSGRISKHLCNLLLKLGAYVTVAARDPSKLAFASSLGCETIRLDSEGKNITRLAHGYDVIYNTVPSWIFGREFLSQVDRECLIIDLASAPGGVDIGAARELSSNVSWATSLPGKYAPMSAGVLIFECIEDIIESGGVG